MKAREAFLWNGLAVYTKRCVIVQQTAHIHHSRPTLRWDLSVTWIIHHSLMQQYLRAKVIKRGNNFFFKKSNSHSSIFPAAVPLSRDKRFSLLWEPKPFPSPLPHCSATCEGTGSGIGTTGVNGEADICLGTGRSVPALVSPGHQQHGKSSLHQKTTSLILMINSVPGLVLHVGSSTLRLLNV